MSAALVSPTEVFPDATDDLSVAEAYAAVKALIAKPAEIAWVTSPCPCGCGYDGIVQRFSRNLFAEAILVARPLAADGKPLGGVPVAVCALKVANYVGDEREAVEAALKAELAAAKAT